MFNSSAHTRQYLCSQNDAVNTWRIFPRTRNAMNATLVTKIVQRCQTSRRGKKKQMNFLRIEVGIIPSHAAANDGTDYNHLHNTTTGIACNTPRTHIDYHIPHDLISCYKMMVKWRRRRESFKERRIVPHRSSLNTNILRRRRCNERMNMQLFFLLRRLCSLPAFRFSIRFMRTKRSKTKNKKPVRCFG